MSKLCKKCGHNKPLDQFYRHPTESQGRAYVCKECKKAYTRSRYAVNSQNPEWMVKARRWSLTEALSPAGKARRIAWEKRNPEKVAARVALGNAVRDGRVQKPCACSRCNTPTWPLHGHHKDYSKPLDVTWLCAKCHHAPTQEPTYGG